MLPGRLLPELGTRILFHAVTDGETAQLMRQKGVDAVQSLNDNDAYHALGAVGGLLKTGATGTNVNDVTVLLLRTAE